jgi:hypothetical protein
VNADGTEVARIADAPKALATDVQRQQRLAKSLSRKQKIPSPPGCWRTIAANNTTIQKGGAEHSTRLFDAL